MMRADPSCNPGWWGLSDEARGLIFVLTSSESSLEEAQSPSLGRTSLACIPAVLTSAFRSDLA